MTPIAQLIAELRELAERRAGAASGLTGSATAIGSILSIQAEHEAALLTRAAEALARQEELLAAVLSAEAWLDRWAAHVGHCRGGDLCECGLTAIRAEVGAAARLSDKLKEE